MFFCYFIKVSDVLVEPEIISTEKNEFEREKICKENNHTKCIWEKYLHLTNSVNSEIVYKLHHITKGGGFHGNVIIHKNIEVSLQKVCPRKKEFFNCYFFFHDAMYRCFLIQHKLPSRMISDTGHLSLGIYMELGSIFV